MACKLFEGARNNLDYEYKVKTVIIRNILALCVGTQLGEIHVFNVPAKGTNVTLKESLIGVYSNH